MKKFGSQHIERLYNHPTGSKFRNNRISINRSNLRVIEAKEETSTSTGNNIEVPCLPQKVKEDLLKNYDDDLDEISDSPLIDDADDLENISDGSLSAESDVENKACSISLESKVEMPIGYRSCSIKRLAKYKKLAFFKPKLYKFSQDRIVVGCVNVSETNSENVSMKNEEISNGNEQDGEPDVETNEVITSKDEDTEPLHGKLMIQEELDGSNEIILGIEFLMEVWNELNVSLRNYLCLLCNEELEKTKVLNHLIGISHRRTYLDKHFPKFTSMFYKNASLENSEEKLPIATVCKVIGDDVSALPFITSHAYLTSHRHELEKEVDKVFHNKDTIALLLKELCLIVAIKHDEFNDDPIDFSGYGAVASESVDSRDSENEKFIILSSDKDNSDAMDDEEIVDIQTDEVNHEMIEPTGKSNSVPIKLCERKPKKHFLKYNYHKHNRRYRFAGLKKCASTKGSSANLQADNSTVVPKSSSKPVHASVPALTEKAKVSAVQPSLITENILSKKNLKIERENKEKASNHCGKCSGFKKSFRAGFYSKRCIKRCNCKKDPSVAIEQEIKQKEDSSKANVLHKSEFSRSVASSSNDERKQGLEGNVLSTKMKYSNDRSENKVHRSKLAKSRFKWQKGDKVIRDVEKSVDKIPGENTVHSRNEKGSPVVQQPRNLEKSNDDKGRHISHRRSSRSPKRSSKISPKRLSDRKSPLRESRNGSRSVIRKGKISPLRQDSRTTIGVPRWRSRSPLRGSISVRKRQLSPDKLRAVMRNRSRSPFRSSRKRSRSPLRKRSRTPPGMKRKRSRSPFTLVRSGRHIPSPPRKGFFSSIRNIRSRQLSPRRRIRSPIRRSERSISPPNRRWRRSKSPPGFPRRHSRSPVRRHTSSISSEESSPFEKKFVDSFQTVDGSFNESVQLPVPPVNPQVYPPETYPTSWNIPNPAGNYNYNYSYPPANPAYLPTTYPQYTAPSVPPYPNVAYPPPVTQTAPALPVSASQYVLPSPLPPIPVGMPPQIVKSDISIPVQYPNTMPTSGHSNEKMFHELQSVVTKLFGASDSRLTSEAESRNVLHKGLLAHENVFDRKVHTDEIPFLSSAGPSNTSQSQKPSEDQERMYLQMLQQLRSEHGSFSSPGEILKYALKGMFPGQLLNDKALDIVNQKNLEQGQSLDKSSKLPNMNAKVEFKESSYVPRQGNIFPIVKQNPTFRNGSFTNPNPSGSSSNFHNKSRNASDVDFRVRSDYPNKAPKQVNSPNAQPEKKSLALRLASVLVKLEMFDVQGPLLSEMLQKIGVFNRALPLQDITEEEIISVLRQNGYLQCE